FATSHLSPEDLVFDDALMTRGAPYDRFVMPYFPDGGQLPSALLDGYDTLVWYTGNMTGRFFTFTSDDESRCAQWLEGGGKHMLLVSAGYCYDLAGATWTTTTDAFAADLVGAQGATYASGGTTPYIFSDGGLVVHYGTQHYDVGYMNPRSDSDALL